MGLDILPLILSCPQSSLSPPGTLLQMTAKRYTSIESAANTRGLTFVFLHGIGARTCSLSSASLTKGLRSLISICSSPQDKEQWEVVIEEMFRLQQDKPPQLRMREAWALDRPNHGDAAVLNSEELLRNRRQGLPASEWAEAVGAFLRSTHLHGHRIVQVAHSAGSMAALSATRYVDLSSVSILSIIVIAPAMLAPETYYRYIEPIALGLSAAVHERRDKWSSREAAHSWMKARFPWNLWDPRVLRAHTDHGIIETPDNSGSVTLKCPKLQEAFCFPDTESQFGAIDQISKICRRIPFHVVWGIDDHLLPQVSRGSISDSAQGRLAKSVTNMKGGHMVLQETPVELARVVSRLCDGISAPCVQARL
ncbi:CN hydrolase domain-containing protein [Favolaschia claudopus]|uniref:CN hydrolase domain-containing protein n=1 Tax=Favolaschia claudopus TaxID=2862362 RepID=A0AAW0CJM5_9AGAR